MSKTPTRKTSLSSQDWVDIASDILADKGIDAVRVEPLARKLKVTKGSFYWHFANRQELLNAVLNMWRKRATSEVIKRLNSSKLPAEERLYELLQFPKHGSHAIQGANLENAIRQWAKHDVTVKQAVDEVDQHRLVFIENIYEELGFTQKDAKTKAVFFYCMMQGMSNIPNLVTESALENGKRMLNERLPLVAIY
jgi:AcrR family transcriptional regulator